MHCGVMVTGYNQGDWGRLMKEEYDRPPEVSDAENMDNTLYMGDLVEPLGFDSIWARTLRFRLLDAAEPASISGILGRADQPGRYGNCRNRGAVVEPGAPGP